MTPCTAPTHRGHAHQHWPACGHPAVRHDGHVDYLHDGHLHHPHEGHVDEHVLEVSSTNPDRCTSDHRCGNHESRHVHRPACGHAAAPRGNNLDYRLAA